MKKTSISKEIKNLNSILAKFANAQFLPEIYPLKTIRNARLHTRPKPTFAEISPKTSINTILAHEDVSKSDREAFFAVLEEERQRTLDLPKDDLLAMEIINNTRIKRIRDVAENLLEELYVSFKKGQTLIASSDLTGEQIDERIRALGKTPCERAKGFAELFPESQENVAIARFLAFLSFRWGAIVPPGDKNDELGQFWSKRISKYGGAKQLEGYLTATNEALVAAITLFQVDSYTNATVARELLEDCLEPSDEPGYKRVVGFKARARGKSMPFDLPESCDEHRITAVRAINMIKEMTARIRKQANGAAKYLFICQGNKNVVWVLPEFAYTAGFKQMLLKDEVLSRLQFVPSLIRPSALMDQALKNDGKLMEIQLQANQKSVSTTHGYTLRLPTRVLYEQKMRKFQGQFQAVVVVDIINAAKKLGLTDAEMSRWMLDAVQSGLGKLCGMHFDDSIKTQENVVSEIEFLGQCSNILVIAKPESIADLLMWNESLHDAQAEWEVNRSNRWRTVWLPWMLFTDTVIVQMSRSTKVAILSEAKDLVAKRKAAGCKNPVIW